MTTFVEFADEIAPRWAETMWPAVWQSTVLAGVLFLVGLFLRRTSASLRFWLWMLVPLRLLVMPFLTIPVPALPAKEAPTAPAVVEPWRASADDYASPESAAADPTAESVLLPAETRDTAAPVPRGARLHALTYLMGAWLLGSSISGMRMVRGWRRMRSIVVNGAEVTDERLLALAGKAASMMGLRRVPRIAFTEEKVSPFSCGIRHPVILLPGRFVDVVSRSSLFAVFAHESAHLRRHDSLAGLILALCEMIYFFHPVVYLARRRILFERERACDDCVLATSNAKPGAYAHALLAAADISRAFGGGVGPAVIVAESFGDLRERLGAMGVGKKPKVGLSTAAVVLLVLLGALCLPGVTLTERQGAAGDAQTIHFPKDRSLGSLQIQDLDTVGVMPPFHWSNADEADWQYFGQARGDVAVPAGKRLRLRVGVAGARDLSPLAKLGPNDLYMLSVGENDDACMPHLAGLTGLKRLVLTGTTVTDEGLRFLKDMKSLEGLVLPNGITAAGLAHLPNLQALKALYVNESQVDSAALSHIAQLRSLETLGLNKCRIHGPGLAQLGKLKDLKELLLPVSDIGDAELAVLKNIPSLRTLDLRFCNVTDAGLAHLSALGELEALNLYDTEVTDGGLVHLKPLRRLKALNLRKTPDKAPITDRGLMHLKALPSLEHLELPNMSITDAGLADIAGCSRLKYLWVGCSSASPITDAGLEHVAKLGVLETLRIGGAGITDKGIGHIARLSNLNELSLTFAPLVTNAALAELATLTSLRRLSLPLDSEMTVSGLTHLNGMPNLVALSAGGLDPEPAGFDISGLTQLEELSLPAVSDWQIAGLAGLKKLTRLHFRHVNSIRDVGMSHLVGLTAMQHLGVGGPYFTDSGLAYLANMRGLVFLTISGEFTDAGLRHLEKLEALYLVDIIDSEDNFSPAAVERLHEKLPNLRIFRHSSWRTSGRGTALRPRGARARGAM